MPTLSSHQLHPNRVCVTAIFSTADIGTQTLLPATLGCRISGTVDETTKHLSLHVTCDKPVEVIAWWPKDWGVAQVSCRDANLEAGAVSFGNEPFIRFALGKGEWDVMIRRHECPASHGRREGNY